MKNRIRAFTLIEIVLAMMLAGIVLGMAYSAFRLFTKIYRDYHSKNIANADVQVFRGMLHDDMEVASVVSLTEGQISFSAVSDSLGLRYLLQPEYIIRRKAGVQDTFRMKRLVAGALFEGRAVSTGIVDQLVFQFEFEDAPMLISVTKKYAAADLFNYTDKLWKQ